MSETVSLNERECNVICWLSDQYESRTVGQSVDWTELKEFLGGNEDEMYRIFERVKGLGLVENTTNRGIYLKSRIVDAARQIRAKEESAKAPVDRVDAAQSWVRRNPWTAYPLIGLLVLTALATFVNQLLGIFERLGWIGGAK